MTASSVNAPKFFVEHKKGEVAEIMNLLKNQSVDKDPKKKKDIIKRVIAYMTLGVDVSKLFHEMVKASYINDIVTKKMVYLYIVNYAEESEAPFVAIQTFINDMKNDNAKIRGLALRNLCSLKFKGVYEYMVKPLYDSLKDPHPYVRKTAILALLKVHKLNPKLITEKDIDLLYDMIKDTDPMVVTNTLYVLNEILKSEGGIQVSTKMVNHLLNYVLEYNEWGQNIILDLLARYTPKDEKQLLDILNTLEEKNFLKHSCTAIVLATCKIFINFTKDTHFYKDVIKRIKDPLITLLSASESSRNYEMTYIILSHIILLLKNGGKEAFIPYFKKFYVSVDEPFYIKKVKLEILIELSNEQIYLEILSEIEEYVNDVNLKFSKYAIESIGELGMRVKKSIDAIVTLLKRFITRNVDYLVSESLSVLESKFKLIILSELLRKYPDIISQFESSLEATIAIVNNNSKGLACLVWILGEFGEKFDNTPYILEDLVDNYSESDNTILINSLLLACCKMFFKSPGEMQEVLGKVFELIFNNFNDIDLKDRASYLYNLLKYDVDEAEQIILGNGSLEVIEKFSSTEDDLNDKIFAEFNTLSVLYKKPEEKFVKRFIEVEEMKKELEEKNIEEAAEETYEEQTPEFIAPVYEISKLNGKAILKAEDYSTYLNDYHINFSKEFSPIPEDVEEVGFIEYLQENHIFTLSHSRKNNVLTLNLYSQDVSH